MSPQHHTWTIMIYMAGKCGPTRDDIQVDATISQLRSVGASDAVAILAQVHTLTGEPPAYRLYIRPADETQPIEPIPQQNTGDPASLRDFIIWGMESYPAHARWSSVACFRRYPVVFVPESFWTSVLPDADAVCLTAVACDLAAQCAHLVRVQSEAALSGWLTAALQSEIDGFVRFTRGSQQDEAAVRHALQLPWSNGVVEGTINRLKTIRRSMDRRGNLDVLERRLRLT